MNQLKKPLIILAGAFFSFVFAYIIDSALFLPDPDLTQIPFILSPLIIAALIVSKPYFIKHHQLFLYLVALPLIAFILGFYLFALVLRNLH